MDLVELKEKSSMSREDAAGRLRAIADELALQPLRAVLDRVALALPVRPEVAVGNLVADDVVVGDQEVVADRADRFGFAAASAELREVRGEVGLFGADSGAGALGQLRGQPGGPWAGSA